MMNFTGFTDMEFIPKEYDKYLWVSNRCIDSIEWSKKYGVDYAVLDGNFNDDKSIMDCMEYLDEVLENVLAYASKVLNDYHHSEYTIDEWRIMLNYWLRFYLFTYYDKYLCVKKFADLGEQYDCNLIDTDNLIPILDCYDYKIGMIRNDENYHLDQYSRIISEIGEPKNLNVLKKTDYIRKPIIYHPKSKGYYKVFLYRTFVKTFKMLTRIQDDVVLEDSSYLPPEYLLKVAKKKPGHITNYILDYFRFERTKLSLVLDKEWRNKKESIPEDYDDFTKIVCRIIKFDLPCAYVENFGILGDMSRKIYKFAKSPKAIIYAAGATAFDEVFKRYLMDIRRTKAKFCGIQHGGDYLINKEWEFESEYQISDIFYIWGNFPKNGWNCTFKPMPMTKMVNISSTTKNNKDDKWLYVTYSYHKYLEICAKNIVFCEDFFRDELRFINGLTQSIRKKMVFRLYPRDFQWKQNAKIQEQNPDLHYDTCKDFYESLSNASFLVVSDWNTTVVEALCMNKPFVVRRERKCLDESAIGDYEEMKKAGILVETFDELNQRLEEIKDNVMEWWNEPARQIVVKKMRDRYAYHPENSEEIWLDEIIRLSNGE
jgi:putative transferase (TIGR04331 family)